MLSLRCLEEEEEGEETMTIWMVKMIVQQIVEIIWVFASLSLYVGQGAKSQFSSVISTMMM